MENNRYKGIRSSYSSFGNQFYKNMTKKSKVTNQKTRVRDVGSFKFAVLTKNN